MRHTLATQSINRGMSLEAIAALLGHRSMDMTLIYARISDRTVADEYFKVTEAVEANYRQMGPLPVGAGYADTTRPPTDHRRLLAKGHCTSLPSSAASSRASANGAGSSRPVRSS